MKFKVALAWWGLKFFNFARAMLCYEHSFLRRNWIQAQFLVSSTAPWPFLEEQILSRSPMPYKSCIDEYNSNPLTSSSIFNKIWPRPTNHTESPHQNTRVQAGGLITRVESVKSEVRSLKSEVGSLKSLLGFWTCPLRDLFFTYGRWPYRKCFNSILLTTFQKQCDSN